MTPGERKAAFRARADIQGKTLSLAALETCGVTWFHLSDGIAGKRPLSYEVKERFAAAIGSTVEDVFGDVPVAQPAA